MLLDINKEHVEKSNSLYNEMVQKFKEKIKLSPYKQQIIAIIKDKNIHSSALISGI